jgi:mannonate dehydratase
MNYMKRDRREFLKKGSMLTAAISLGGIANSLKSDPVVRIRKNSGRSKAYIKDAGMKFCFAYFWGIESDMRKIEFARQLDVPGVVGGINAGSVGLKDVRPWDYEAIVAVKNAWEKQGLKLEVIEGPPALSEKTKLGLDGRDEEISNFILLMKNLTKAGINTICYNWMPVISWARTTNDRPGRGGALVTAFDNEDIKDATPTRYGEVTKESLWKNLEYFLKAVIPEAEKCGMKLAMHPDDPQVDSIRGISRIMNTPDSFRKMADIYPSVNNGITMCQGNFALMGVDLPALIREFGKRGLIHFVHFRNVRGGKFNFEETFHDEGMIDMFEAMRGYIQTGFTGPIRPDHVPTMAGDSNNHPGYSTLGNLYATGYIRGLMEAAYKSL